MVGEGRAGTRGTRGRGTRGRGRGARGRGGASSAAEPSAANDDAPNVVPDAPMNDAPAVEPSPSVEPTQPPAAMSSNAQQPATSAAASSSNSRPTPPGPVRGARGRIMPRAIRRSQVERESIAARESAKLEDKAAQDARLKRAARGGRGGGRRARGGAPGGFFDRVISAGAGGFGSDIQATGSRGGPSVGFGRLYDIPSASGSSSGGGRNGFSSNFQGVKSENGLVGFPNDSSSRPTGRRMNTDLIAELAHMDLGDETKNENGQPSALLPKGMFRKDHLEAQQPDIATSEELEAAERGEAPVVISSGSSDSDDLFYNQNDAPVNDDGTEWVDGKDKQRIKVEDEDKHHTIDEFLRVKRKAEKEAREKEEARKKEEADKNAKMKKAAVYEDPEDQWHAEKMAGQRMLFGIDSDSENDEGDENGSKEKKAPRKPLIVEGGVYLLQLPPIMPPLYEVKKDENGNIIVPENPEYLEKPRGYLGDLTIRKSGKMEMDWGGMIFDVETALPRNFYRECVVIDDTGKPEPDADGFHGTAYSMGPVLGQFNAAYRFSDAKPWVVDPADLPPWGCDAAPEGTNLEDYQ